MSWVYEQLTGRLTDPSGTIVATGYAGGNCGRNPEGINNPLLQDIKCIGPIPRGVYAFGEPFLQSHLGPFAIPLIPDKKNEMHGRSGFFMHGDTKAPRCASEGCIIMPRMIRDLCAHSEDRILTVKE